MSSREETLAKIEAGEDAEDAIRDAAPEVQADKAVVLTAVVKDRYALRHASVELRGDKEFIKAVVAKKGYALQHASEELRGDKEVALAAVAQNGHALQYASEELRGDKEFIKAAVAKKGYALKHASKEFRGDKDVALAAVAQDGDALRHASEELRGDEEVALAAVAQNGDALRHASEELRGDKEFMLNVELLGQVQDSGMRSLACEMLKRGLAAGFESTLPLLCHPDDSMQAVGASVAAACFAPAEVLADPEPELDPATEANRQPEMRAGELSEAVVDPGTEPEPETGAEAATDAEADADKTMLDAPLKPAAVDWWEGDGEWVFEGQVVVIETCNGKVTLRHSGHEQTGELSGKSVEFPSFGRADLSANGEALTFPSFKLNRIKRRQRPVQDYAKRSTRSVVMQRLVELLLSASVTVQQHAAKALTGAMCVVTKEEQDLILSEVQQRPAESLQKQHGWRLPEPDAEAAPGERIFVEGHGTGEVSEYHSEEEAHTIKFDMQEGVATKVKLLRNSNGGKNWLLPPAASAETDWEANGAKDLDTARPRAASAKDVCLWMHRHKEPIVQLHAGLFSWTKLREDDQPGVNGDELLRLSDHDKLKNRVHVVTEPHRQALLDAIKPLAGYLWRYRMVEGPPVHLSRSAEAGYAQDELASPHQEVCVKRMKHWEQFKAEIDARFKDDGTPLSTDAVITVLRWHTPPGVSLVDSAGQTEEPQHTSKDDKHPYALVMARGQRSLHDACAKERIAGYDIETVIEVFRSILLCVLDLHDAGVCHADLKQRNILRFIREDSTSTSAETERRSWIICDMDAATHTGKPIGKKTSTAYSPPELARVRASDGEQLQIASTSFDVWSLGVMLFELCTGRTLFRQDTSNDDLLMDEDKDTLCAWQEISETELEEVFASLEADDTADIKRQDAKHMIRWCLQGDPLQRPDVKGMLKHRFLYTSSAEVSEPVKELAPASWRIPKQLHSHIEAGSVQEAGQLFEDGSAHWSLSLPDRDDSLPLHRAARLGDAKMLRAMIEVYKGQPDTLVKALSVQVPPFLFSPLHWCTSYGTKAPDADGRYTETAKLLIKHGCKTDLLNHRGKTAWDLAEVESGVDAVFKQLAEEHNDLHEEQERRRLRPDVVDTFRDDLQLDHRRFTLWDINGTCESYGEPIAEGGFGKIYQINDVSPPIEVNGNLYRRVAMKVPKPGGVDELRGEVESLGSLVHDNVVQILGMTEGPAPGTELAWQMCLEFCDTDILKLVYHKEPAAKDPAGMLYAEYSSTAWVSLMVDFAQQIAAGLVYIHGHDRPHLDLKPENVLLARGQDAKLVPKLADFGMAYDTAADAMCNQVYGTWEYMPPECLKREHGEPGLPSDIFSFGLMLWEMVAQSRVYRAFPGFEDDDEAPTITRDDGKRAVNVRQIASRLAGGQRPAPSAGCPELLHQLMEACWVHDMGKRPTAQALLDAIKQIHAAEGALDPPPEPPPPPEQPEEILSYDGLLGKLGLQDKKEELAEYLSSPGAELTELMQMDEVDLRDDILEDWGGLTPEQQDEFCTAVEQLRCQSEPGGVDGGDSGGVAVDSSSEDAWVTLTARLGLGGDETAALRKERDAALEREQATAKREQTTAVERDAALEREQATANREQAALAELAELRSHLEKKSTDPS